MGFTGTDKAAAEALNRPGWCPALPPAPWSPRRGMDTHYLATEYGVVNLMGKSTRDRVVDIVSLAHPKFRDDLLAEAKKMGLV